MSATRPFCSTTMPVRVAMKTRPSGAGASEVGAASPLPISSAIAASLRTDATTGSVDRRGRTDGRKRGDASDGDRGRSITFYCRSARRNDGRDLQCVLAHAQRRQRCGARIAGLGCSRSARRIAKRGPRAVDVNDVGVLGEFRRARRRLIPGHFLGALDGRAAASGWGWFARRIGSAAAGERGDRRHRAHEFSNRPSLWTHLHAMDRRGRKNWGV